MKECNPPLVGNAPKILILGSMPGEESLKQKQYFAFKHNRFWRIMFEFFNWEFSNDYETRKQMMKENGIALWDTIQRCEREGSSLDGKIRNEEPVALEQFLAVQPTIRVIFLNGSKACAVYKKHFSAISLPVVQLPSTSPANATMRFERLFDVWKSALLKHLSES